MATRAKKKSKKSRPCRTPEEGAALRVELQRRKAAGETLTKSETDSLGGLVRASRLSKKEMSAIGRKGAEQMARNLAAKLGLSAEHPAADCPPAGYTGAPCGKVLVPGGFEHACYALREADALVTSHNPSTWQVDPKYPSAVQERDYQHDKAEQVKVARIGAKPDPALLLSNSPTAVDGPPVVSGKGYVLGGNGRTMGLKLAYSSKNADGYRAELATRASLFGLDAKDVEGMTAPVLVRVVEGLDQRSTAALAAMSSKLNEGLTQQKGEHAASIALGRRLSPETLSLLGASVSERGTLRQAMADDAALFIRRLRADSILTDANASEWLESDGQRLSSFGKDRVEAAYLGRVVDTSERLTQASKSTLDKLGKIAPALLRVEARQNGHDILPALREGMDALHAAKAASMTLAQLGSQVGSGVKPRAIEAAGALSTSSKVLGTAMEAWSKAADFDPKQATMFSKPATPEAAWALLLKAAGVEPRPDSAPAVQSAEPAPFVAQVLEAAPRVPASGRHGMDRVYLLALYRAMYPDGTPGRPLLPVWKADIAKAAAAGELHLSALDAEEIQDEQLYLGSELSTTAGRVQLLNLPLKRTA